MESTTLGQANRAMITVPVPVILLTLVSVACAPATTSTRSIPVVEPAVCTGPTHPSTRWTLYFGTARPNGTVTETDWSAFLRDEVTPRFPDGFTAMDGTGQWRGGDGKIVQEKTRILVLIQPDTKGIRFAVGEIVNRYKALFQQEAVLEELSAVCAGF
jgi:Protein of unknown function (DUF3574)